jgi:GntR family transcriptional regulator
VQIDINSSVPLYEQIYQQFSNYINNKILPVKDRLPSVIELSSMLHVNPNTVLNSYGMLEEKKCIHSIPGKAIFISEIHQDK